MKRARADALHVVVDNFPGGFIDLAPDESSGALVETLRIYDAVAPIVAFPAIVSDAQRAGPAFPRVLAHARAEDGRERWIRFEHVPRLPLRRLLDEEHQRGIALPMALSLVKSLASSLLATERAHGTPGLDCAAVAADGSARLHHRPYLPRVALEGADEMLFTRNVDTLAPELVQTHSLTAAADVFTLGAVLFALIAGRSPFRRGDWVSTMRALVVPAPRLVHDGAPPELTRVIDQMTRRELSERMYLADVVPALDAAAPWAQWTNEQVAAELRAMLPDEYARLVDETERASARGAA